MGRAGRVAHQSRALWRCKEDAKIDIPRPRSVEILTSPKFVELKRQVTALIREETMKSVALASLRG